MFGCCNNNSDSCVIDNDIDIEDLSTSDQMTIAIQRQDEGWVKSLLGSPDKEFDILTGSYVCQATEVGHAGVLQALLKAGGDPNEPDLYCERHAVHICAGMGHLAALQVLVSHGADINQCDSDHRTPMHWVAMYGTHSLIKWMVEHGSLPDQGQKDGFTPLHTASCLGYEEVCRQLVAEGGADMDRKDKEGWSPLLMAVCYGYMDLVTTLVGLGADLLALTSQEESSLHIACSKGNLDMVELLLDLGVPIESTNIYGSTPLHYAISFGHLHVTYALIKAGAHVNLQFATASRACPFKASALLGNRGMLELLLSTGCVVSPSITCSLQQRRDIPNSIVTEACRFPSLLRLCTIAIRRQLAPHLQEKALCLPLPQMLKDSLALKCLTLPAPTADGT